MGTNAKCRMAPLESSGLALPGLISDDPASRNTSVLTHHAIFPVYWGSLRKFFEAVANANLGQLSFFPRGAHGQRRQLLSGRPSDRGQRGNHSRRGSQSSNSFHGNFPFAPMSWSRPSITLPAPQTYTWNSYGPVIIAMACQNQTHALQQTVLLFHYLVRAGKQCWRNFEAERPRGL
jgi:hypothetical protein